VYRACANEVKVYVTDIPVVKVHVDELSSARIWQHKLCATLSASVNINYCLPIKVYYRICTVRHIRMEIIHGSQNCAISVSDFKLCNLIIMYLINLFLKKIKIKVNF
jgi:hypothetical protein